MGRHATENSWNVSMVSLFQKQTKQSLKAIGGGVNDFFLQKIIFTFILKL